MLTWAGTTVIAAIVFSLKLFSGRRKLNVAHDAVSAKGRGGTEKKMAGTEQHSIREI